MNICQCSLSRIVGIFSQGTRFKLQKMGTQVRMKYMDNFLAHLTICFFHHILLHHCLQTHAGMCIQLFWPIRSLPSCFQLMRPLENHPGPAHPPPAPGLDAASRSQWSDDWWIVSICNCCLQWKCLMVHPYICLQISPRRASSTDVNGEAEQPDDTAEGEGEGVFIF